METGVTMAFSNPRKLRTKVCTKIVLDNFEAAVLRRTFHIFDEAVLRRIFRNFEEAVLRRIVHNFDEAVLRK